MKYYELEVNREIRWNVTEEDIVELFRAAVVSRGTPCRIAGAPDWHDVNEYFPLLKHGIFSSGEHDSAPALSHAQRRGTGARKVGLLCFGCGVLCAAGAMVAFQPGTAQSIAVPSVPVTRRFATAPQPAPVIPPSATQFASRSIVIPEQPARIRTVSPPSVANTQAEYPVRRAAPTPAPAKPTEITVPLDTNFPVTTAYGSFYVKIHDNGPVTFTLSLNHGQPFKMEKVKGFETTGSNIVQIYELPRAKVYYVDRIGVSTGYCVLKVIPNS